MGVIALAAMDFVRAEAGAQPAAGEGFVPEVLFEGNYYPICGHYFWDSDYGAETVCKALGFDGGAKTNTAAKFEEHAMPVGRCNQGEELDKCSGGGNAWGDLDTNDGWCNAGNTIGVEVTCTGHSLTHSLTHSSPSRNRRALRVRQQPLEKTCTCANGVGKTGADCSAEGAAECASCSEDYEMNEAGTACEGSAPEWIYACLHRRQLTHSIMSDLVHP